MSVLEQRAGWRLGFTEACTPRRRTRSRRDAGRACLPQARSDWPAHQPALHLENSSLAFNRGSLFIPGTPLSTPLSQNGKNDSILIDGIIAQRAADQKPSDDIGEVFEYFSFEQILKQYDLTDEELEAGWVDGRHDGGIDGFFIFVNGHFVSEMTVTWPKSHAQVDVIVISCKHHDTFKEATLNSMLATVQELFDLSIDAANLKGSYSSALSNARKLLARVYEKLANTNPRLTLSFMYCSRGDASDVGESVKARSEQIRHLAASLFSEASATFTFTVRLNS